MSDSPPPVPPTPPLPPPGPPPPYGAPYAAPQGPPPGRSRRTLWIVLGVVGAVALLCVGGCTAALVAIGASADPPSRPVITLPSTVAGPEPSTGPVPFGAEVTKPDGMAFVLVPLGARARTDRDFGVAAGSTIHSFRVTVRNGSTRPFSLGVLFCTATYGSGQEAEKPLGGQSASVAPGATGTTTLEFATPSGYTGTFTVSVHTGFTTRPAVFTGTV